MLVVKRLREKKDLPCVLNWSKRIRVHLQPISRDLFFHFLLACAHKCFFLLDDMCRDMYNIWRKEDDFCSTNTRSRKVRIQWISIYFILLSTNLMEQGLIKINIRTARNPNSFFQILDACCYPASWFIYVCHTDTILRPVSNGFGQETDLGYGFFFCIEER